MWLRYENLPDPETDASLPVVTITDFASGEAGKEVILLVAGEHARELITSEIVFWLGKLLSGKDDELADWAAVQTATALAWKRGWAKGTLKEWAEELLGKVIFKVGINPTSTASYTVIRRLHDFRRACCRSFP